MNAVSKVEDILRDISTHQKVWTDALSKIAQSATGGHYDVWLSADFRICDAAEIADRGNLSAAAAHLAPVLHHIQYALSMEHEAANLRDGPDEVSYYKHELGVLGRLDALIKAQDGIPMDLADWVLPEEKLAQTADPEPVF